MQVINISMEQTYMTSISHEYTESTKKNLDTYKMSILYTCPTKIFLQKQPFFIAIANLMTKLLLKSNSLINQIFKWLHTRKRKY